MHMLTTLPLRLPSRPREPSFENGPRQRRMAHAALSREGPKDLQILLIKAERDLLRARRSNLDVEVLQILSEFLDAVARPEVSLFSVAPESWNPTLLCSYGAHYLSPLPPRQRR